MLKVLEAYRERTRLAQALRQRSSRIRSAIEQYNKAAGLISPPQPPLSFEEVLEYVSTNQFEILRDSRHRLLDRPWTNPRLRQLAATHFRQLAAVEELQRVKVESRRLLQFVDDVEIELRGVEDDLKAQGDPLSKQVGRKLNLLGSINSVHRYRIRNSGIIGSDEVEGREGRPVAPFARVGAGSPIVAQNSRTDGDVESVSDEEVEENELEIDIRNLCVDS